MMAMSRGGLMKIVAEKIKPTFSIFSERFSSPIEGFAMMARRGRVCGWLDDENRKRKN